MTRSKYSNYPIRFTLLALALLCWLAGSEQPAHAQSGVDTTMNHATLTGGAGGPLTTPITDTAPVTIYDLPTIALAKRLQSAEPLRVGEAAHFTIEITNTGNITISSLTLEDRHSHVFLTYNGGSTTPAPTSSSGGFVLWDSLLPANGLAPNQQLTVNVYFDAAADTTLLTPLAPCTMPNAAPNLARLFSLQADPDGAGPLPAVDMAEARACASVRIYNPTAVTLAERTVIQSNLGVVVRWSTVNEQNIVGFQLWRVNGIETELRTSAMIPAQAAGQASGASYEWLDAGARLAVGDTYLLEIIKADGSTERIILDVKAGAEFFLPFTVR